MAEDLGTVLARTIRAHPEFFLRQLVVLGVSCSSVRWVLNVPGLEYVDRPNAKRYEIRMRRNALSGVRRPDLAVIRDQCLKELGRSD